MTAWSAIKDVFFPFFIRQLVLAREKSNWLRMHSTKANGFSAPHFISRDFDEWARAYSFDDDANEMPFLFHFLHFFSFTHFPLANGENLAPNPIKSCFRLYFNNICTCEYWPGIGKKEKQRLNNTTPLCFLWNKIPIRICVSDYLFRCSFFQSNLFFFFLFILGFYLIWLNVLDLQRSLKCSLCIIY